MKIGVITTPAKNAEVLALTMLECIKPFRGVLSPLYSGENNP